MELNALHWAPHNVATSRCALLSMHCSMAMHISYALHGVPCITMQCNAHHLATSSRCALHSMNSIAVNPMHYIGLITTSRRRDALTSPMHCLHAMHRPHHLMMSRCALHSMHCFHAMHRSSPPPLQCIGPPHANASMHCIAMSTSRCALQCIASCNAYSPYRDFHHVK